MEESPSLRIIARLEVRHGRQVSVGREAEVRLGDDPLDKRVSRVALELTATPDGWIVAVHNRNGVVVHPWGLPGWHAQAMELATSQHTALRVVGDPGRRYWVLLERAAGGPSPASLKTLRTDLDSPVRPLTAAQNEVVSLLFDELLAWPPVVPAEPLQLKQVARKLGISVSAVQARLGEIRGKAVALGLSREVTNTDPEYLYVLVRAEYIGTSLMRRRFAPGE